MIRSPGKVNTFRNAFTLVEVLIALLITSVMGGAAISLLYTYLRNYEQSSEYTTALQRGQMVLSILRPVVLNGAFSVPWKTASFNDLASSLGLSSMKAPLEIRDKGTMKSGDIRILYALPSSLAAAQDVDDISVPFSVSLFPKSQSLDSLISFLNAAYVYPEGTDYDRWVIFPSGRIPLQTDKKPVDLSLSLKKAPGGINGKISQGDRLFILRYMSAYVDKQYGLSSTSFFVKDNSNSPMPQVHGIRRLFFDWDGNGRILNVWVLSQGDSVMREPLSQDVYWPPESGYSITSDDLKHYLAVSNETWRVRN